MRKTFAESLLKAMGFNKDIFLVTGDLGYGLLDEIRKTYPDRFINVGAAEQTMLNVGIGLALKGRVPVVYSITPFLLHRPFEAIKLYLEHEGIPVILVGSGRGKDYEHDGKSHEALPDFYDYIKINQYVPSVAEDIPTMLTEILKSGQPGFLSLKR